MRRSKLLAPALVAGLVVLTACPTPKPPPPPQHKLLVERTGSGKGSVSSDPAGISCPDTCVMDAAEGLAISLSATAEAGSVFAGWSGACSGSGACSLTMSADQTVTARFILAGEVDGGVDGGPVDAGFKCRIDDDCAALKNGTRCDTSTNECVAARGCIDDSTCGNLSDPNDYCYYYDLGCRCVTEANDGGLPGVCRRRRGVCEPCTANEECGSTAGVFDPVGACRPVGLDGGKYCLQEQQGSTCGCGMINDGSGYCKPQSNSCANVGCTEDKSCPGGQVCNKSKCLCENRCRWDFAKASESPPGCPPNNVCWVDNANLDPTSIYYGAGRCRPACSTNADCTDTVSNPYGGSKLKCAAEQLAGGGTSSKRCRADGECMDNLECPVQPPQSIYLGYCDRGAFKCMTDCRVGSDPVTGTDYKDCRSDYKCESADGGNKCVLKTCAEAGGARIACRRGQYCCGEDKNGDGTVDPCPPLNEREPNGCYDAPKPPYCFECKKHEDCTGYTAPSWLTGPNACANGSKSPSCSPLPNLCRYAGDRPGGPQGGGIFVCASSTWNDTTKDKNGVGKDNRGCPVGWTAKYVPVDFLPNDWDNCTTNADCQIGNDAGICDFDQGTFLPDGGHPKTCLCSKPGQVGECPTNPDAGLVSVCKFGIAVPSICLQSVVCEPQPGLVYFDAGAPNFGCGL